MFDGNSFCLEIILIAEALFRPALEAKLSRKKKVLCPS